MTRLTTFLPPCRKTTTTSSHRSAVRLCTAILEVLDKQSVAWAQEIEDIRSSRALQGKGLSAHRPQRSHHRLPGFSSPHFLAPKLRTSKKQRLVLYEEFSGSHNHRTAHANPENSIGSKMRSYLQFITTPTADTPGTTIYVHFDNKRYLIGNIAEGTQRATIERSLKLTRVSDIFLTGRVEWANVGGLLGVVLTLADAIGSSGGSPDLGDAVESKKGSRPKDLDRLNRFQANGSGESPTASRSRSRHIAEEPSLTVHGGANLTHMFATARRFIFRKGLPLHVQEFLSKEDASATNPKLPKTDQSLSSTSTAKDGQNDHVRASTFSAHENSTGEVNPSTLVTGSGREPFTPTWRDENIRVWVLPIHPHKNSPSSAPVSVVSPRKRSFDELQGASPHEIQASITQDQQVRKAVVSEMFGSTWRLDSLIAMPLSQVKLPAEVFVKNKESGQIEEYTGSLLSQENNAGASDSDAEVLVRSPWPAALVESLPPARSSDIALSYILKNHPQRGQFLKSKAIALGIKPGPAFGRLTKGQSVTASDGSIVTPDMVMAEGKEGGGVAIVELPSADYVEDLIGRAEWGAHEVMDGIGAVVWMLGPGVGQDEKLRRFMWEQSQLKHIISSPDACPNYLAFDSAAAAAIRLNRIDPLRFPCPLHDNDTLPQHESNDQSGLPHEQGRLIPAQRGQLVQLEPTIEIQDTSIPPFLDTARVETFDSVLQLAEEGRKALAAAEAEETLGSPPTDLPGRDAEMVTLGTGSALPSKYRNVSATLLRVPGHGSYLFDCGENTLGQLRRVFAPEELAEILRDLKAIWISHLHADHHLGTTSVIKAWHQEVWGGTASASSTGTAGNTAKERLKILENEQRLFVISDERMVEWLGEYASMEDFGYSRIVPLEVHSAQPFLSPARETVLKWDNAFFSFGNDDNKLSVSTTNSIALSS